MKRCKFEKTAHRYMDGELGSEMILDFEEHLKECAGCQTVTRDVLVLRSIVGDGVPGAALAGFEERLLKSVRLREMARKKWFFWQRGRSGMKRNLIAAAVLVGLFVVSGVVFMTGYGVTNMGSDGELLASDNYYMIQDITMEERALLTDDSDRAVEAFYASVASR